MHVVRGQLYRHSDSLETDAEFTSWVQPQLPAMRRLATRLAQPHDVDDVIQEALARAWMKRAQFDPLRGSPSAWLLAITADQARKASRMRWRFDRLISWLSFRRLNQPDTSDWVSDPDLMAAIRKLSTRQRLAVDSYYFADLSTAETAAVMRCSQGTVKSTLSDARRSIRTTLEGSNGSHR
jgi:RNA polymerase sigma factor (sigma-70 family)